MKYMLLIYQNPASREVLGDQLQEMMREVDAIVTELTESGEFIGGLALADPEHSKTVRVKGGVPAVTDGPYLEAKEHLAGYAIIECDTHERALEIAARWPDARVNGVELRPVMDEAGMEM